ncbi:MAG: 30S ribosomal protein S4e [Candidatus Nanoarchaeia archaeon]
MAKSHLKRLAIPSTWPLAKKTLTYISRPLPGAHKMAHQVSLVVFLRDIAQVVDTKKQAKYLLHNKECFVDGKVVYNDKRPVGFLDVVSLPTLKKFFRVSITSKNKLVALEISEKEAAQKISKVRAKTSLRKGKIQLNTLDGRSIIIDDPKKYLVGDSVLISLPDQKIIEHFSMKPGALIFLDAGRHVGNSGTVESVDDTEIVVKTTNGVFRTKRKYAVVLGKDKPAITM